MGSQIPRWATVTDTVRVAYKRGVGVVEKGGTEHGARRATLATYCLPSRERASSTEARIRATFLP